MSTCILFYLFTEDLPWHFSTSPSTNLRHVDVVFKTLSYFDGVNFAARAKAKTLFSVALMDEVCPPSTVYAAYNYWAGEKEIQVYPYNGHEGGGSYQTVEKLKFLKRIWK